MDRRVTQHENTNRTSLPLVMPGFQLRILQCRVSSDRWWNVRNESSLLQTPEGLAVPRGCPGWALRTAVPDPRGAGRECPHGAQGAVTTVTLHTRAKRTARRDSDTVQGYFRKLTDRAVEE